MSGSVQYDADYFLRGKETGKSLYSDYRWMPESTSLMAEKLAAYMGISAGDTILDFGCARGYLVKALRLLGHDAWGIDTSAWAIDNADEETRPYLERSSADSVLLTRKFDWIIAKDVLEHVPYAAHAVSELMDIAGKGLLVVVPLSAFNGMPYVIDDYEKDVTHIQRYNLLTWVNFFLRPGWRVEASYRLPGCKDNWYKPGWEKGNGFILARRLGE